MRLTVSRVMRAVAAVVLVFCAGRAAVAQLDERCTVSVLNRTVRVSADGTWVLPNIPANFGRVKARATCVRDGVTTSGESDFFDVPANGSVDIPPIVLSGAAQVPASLVLTPATPSFSAAGQTLQLVVTAVYPDGSSRVVTAAEAGTSYTTSNPSIAGVSAGGLLTAVGTGTAIIQATNDGATAMMTATVVLSGADSDGDSIPDDAEVRLGLDPRNPADAQEDFDRDGFTNLEEYRLGTDIRLADRDEDGLSDGDELNTHRTSPLQPDTDGDDIPDGVEVRTGSNPLDRNSYDLLKAAAGSIMSPASFTLKTSLLFPNASTRLGWKVTLIDGKTTLDLTADPQTNYSSNNVSVCNFGARKGEVFAGSAGACVVTASNGTLSVGVPGTVESFTPKALSYVDIPGFANNVEVGGNYAYVAAGGAGLQVVDVSDRSRPRVAASRGLPGNANDVALSGDYAYVAAGSGGLQVVNISNPLTPVVIGSLNTAGVAWDVVVKGNRAYVANGTAGLFIVDVSTPSAPARLGSLTMPPPFFAIGVDVDPLRQIAVLAQGANGVAVVNVANPSVPNLMSRLAGGDVRDVVISGNHALLADYSRSFSSIDLTNPSQPVLRASANRNFAGLLQDVSVYGHYAAGADVFFVNGVPLIDVTNPASPQPRTIIDFRAFRDDNGTGVALDASYVYLTADPTGSDNGVSGTTRLYIGQYQNIGDDLGVRPSIRITAPAPGAQAIKGDPLTVTVDAADDVAVASVSLFVNGQQAFTTTTPPHQYTFNAPATGSTLTLGATATDFGGNVARADDVTLNLVPDPPPSVQITSPASGAQAIHGGT
ncbi:MAG: Ig-like domain-containing protein, partial [Pyrinomonadaceae bacterium]